MSRRSEWVPVETALPMPGLQVVVRFRDSDDVAIAKCDIVKVNGLAMSAEYGPGRIEPGVIATWFDGDKTYVSGERRFTSHRRVTHWAPVPMVTE